MPQWWIRSAEPEPELEETIEQSGAIALTTLPIIAKPQPAAPVAPEPEPIAIEQPPPPLEQVPLEQVVDNVLEDIQEEVDEEPEEKPEDPIEEDIEEVPVPPPETTDNTLEADIAFVFNNDFPHIDGAASGCGNYGLENCRTVDGKNFNDVTAFLRQDLAEKGYNLEDVTPEDDDRYDNQKIFKMSDPDDPNIEIRYLNIFGDGLANAFYIITPDIITKQELEDLISTLPN
ncbi:MAG: hypothetical protein KTR27_04930 [Leptolyngbyaceae cyanobacterium MAG.088]|nr:hypothetical protein [Leptolyngbyaceae cyanobacterium MAG.088]